ncbi:MAG: 2,3-bisphosphoglycerate-independent phosphoglycerate mutase [bacterium]
MNAANAVSLQELTRKLKKHSDAKIVLVVADGLGGLPMQPGGETELETARTPNLDRLARMGTTGLMDPVLPGITCGSGPGHLALFGYDPLEHQIGRGVLSALGVDFDLQTNDIAARGNFCTVDENGVVRDRRAGRIPDEEGRRLVDKLRGIELDGVQIFIEHVKQYRFAVIFRGLGSGDRVNDTDPQATGSEPVEPAATGGGSEKTAAVVKRFIAAAREILADEAPANMILLRGFSSRPDIPTLREVYGVDGGAIAIYPMYRGLSRLLGMDVGAVVKDLAHQLEELERMWDAHDFFFLHYKYTDSTGEDGDFGRKVQAIEELDSQMPRILERKPDVLIVTGDHSTPSRLRSHSWHPVPVLLSAATCRPDRAERFGEREAMCGGIGRIEGKYLMLLALAHAGKLDKFGA